MLVVASVDVVLWYNCRLFKLCRYQRWASFFTVLLFFQSRPSSDVVFWGDVIHMATRLMAWRKLFCRRRFISVHVVSIQNGFWRRPHLTQSISQLSYVLQMVSFFLFPNLLYTVFFFFFFCFKINEITIDLLYQGVMFIVKISRFA